MNEAWIFLSIGDAGGANDWVSLADLIDAADMNNHAIPLAAELEEAVSNLVAAGLVETRATETRLTPAGSEVFSDANLAHVGHIKRMFDLGAAWKARGYPPDVPRTWFVDPITVLQAARSTGRTM